MSQCGDQNDIFVYVLNVFIGIAIAVYFLPCKKITLYNWIVHIRRQGSAVTLPGLCSTNAS